MQNTDKGRYWTILVFEDNIEKNPHWLDKLLDTHMRFVRSPYHDMDTWTELDIDKHPERHDIVPGEKKKAHYHIMFHCDSNTTYLTMKTLCLDLGLPIPERVNAPCGMYRYFIHQDNPEKYQYSADDMRHYNGSDPFDYIMEFSEREKMDMQIQLISYLREKRFLKYSEFLLSVAQDFSDPRYYKIATGSTLLFKECYKDNLADNNASIMALARKTV